MAEEVVIDGTAQQIARADKPPMLAAEKAGKRVWIQLAEVGKFKGHPAGEFELSPKVFDQIVNNFHRDKLPIPIDFEHASEQEPTEGTVPSEGTPANGWIHDLDNRGSGGLWGQVEWLEPARGYIKEGKYKYISPAVRFDAFDRVTGLPIGARLTSAGLTNQPFLRNMQPLVARDGSRTAVYCMSAAMPQPTERGLEIPIKSPPLERPEIHASMAHHPMEYMGKVRACLKLPELASAKECADKLERLRDMHAEAGGSMTSDGVDLSDYMRNMRDFVSAAPGTKWEQVFDLMEDLIDAAMDKHEIIDHGGGAEMTDPKMPRPGHADKVEDKAEMSAEHRDAEPGAAGSSAGVDPRDGRGDAKAHANPPEVPMPSHGHEMQRKEGKTINPHEATMSDVTTMSDDNKLVVALRDARNQVSELTLKLKDANQDRAVLQAENEHLKTVLATNEEAALLEEVHVAFETYKDVKKLTAMDKPALMRMARADRDSFRQLYPVVPPNQRYLMREVTPPAPKREPDPFLATDGRVLSFTELTQKLMTERKLSFDDAQNEAVRMMRSSNTQARAI